MLLAGLMVPDQVLIVPRFVIMREFGWLDTYQGLIIPLIFSSFGVFMLRQYLLGIPRDFHEAATLEGANPFQIYLAHLSAAGATGPRRLRLPVAAGVLERIPLGPDRHQLHRHARPSGRHRPLPGPVLHQHRRAARRRQHGHLPAADRLPLLPETLVEGVALSGLK